MKAFIFDYKYKDKTGRRTVKATSLEGAEMKLESALRSEYNARGLICLWLRDVMFLKDV